MRPPKDPRYERWRWQIFSITWLAYAGFYLTRKSFSVAKNELKKPAVMGLTTGQMSRMDGAYSAGYALGQFIWGPLGDRFGTRKVILLGMMASIVTALAMGLSSSVWALTLCYALQGLWQASGWAPLGKNMGEFFSRNERGTIMGFWCTSYALGGFIANWLAGHFAERYGWRYAFYGPAVILFIVWVAFFLFQRNRPEDVGLPSIETYHGERESVPIVESRTPESPVQDIGTWTAIGQVLRSKMVWFLAFIYFLVKPTRYLLLFWSPFYVNERLGTSTAESGFLSSMFDLAGPLGTLAGGFVSDQIFGSRRMPVAVIALFSLAILMVIFPFIPLGQYGVAMGMFAMGFLIYIPDSLISGAAAIDFGTKRGASTANGIINGVGSVGQMFGVMLPGYVESLLGQGQNIWPAIFVSLGCSLALAGLLLLPQWNRLPPER